jgi:hypothetical protein
MSPPGAGLGSSIGRSSWTDAGREPSGGLAGRDGPWDRPAGAAVQARPSALGVPWRAMATVARTPGSNAPSGGTDAGELRHCGSEPSPIAASSAANHLKTENENCSRACCDRQLRISGRTKHEGGQRGHSALQLTAWRQLPGKALVSKFGLAMYRFPTRDRDTPGTGTCRRVCLHLGPEWADEFQEAAIAEESIKKPWGAAGGARRSDDAIADLGTLPRAAPAVPLLNGFFQERQNRLSVEAVRRS